MVLIKVHLRMNIIDTVELQHRPTVIGGAPHGSCGHNPRMPAGRSLDLSGTRPGSPARHPDATTSPTRRLRSSPFRRPGRWWARRFAAAVSRALL